MQPLPRATQRGIFRKQAGEELVRNASGSEDADLTVQSTEKKANPRSKLPGRGECLVSTYEKAGPVPALDFAESP